MMPPLYEGNDLMSLIEPTVDLSGDDCTALAIDWQVVFSINGFCVNVNIICSFLDRVGLTIG
jgi:hypothetical protein